MQISELKDGPLGPGHYVTESKPEYNPVREWQTWKRERVILKVAGVLGVAFVAFCFAVWFPAPAQYLFGFGKETIGRLCTFNGLLGIVTGFSFAVWVLRNRLKNSD